MKRLMTGFLICLAVLFSAGQTCAQFGPLVEESPDRGQLPIVESRHQMVASANPLATAAGKKMLDAGGSATDAVIAMQLVLGLVEPQSSGIGGGGFLLTHDPASKTTRSFDGRETAPASATPQLYLGDDGKPVSLVDAFQGARSVGVPGMVRLMEAAHKADGKLPWAKLFEPAIALARSGFAVSPRMAGMIANAQGLISHFPATAKYLLDKKGVPLVAGTRLKNPAYAKLLRGIARKGADDFYTGRFATDAVAAMAKSPVSPATMTAADFAGYKVVDRAPLCGRYRSYRVCAMGPPSSAAVALLQSLQMLNYADLRALGPASAQSIHLIAESLAVAFADRELYLADPAFMDVPVKGLLDPDYVEKRWKLVDPARAGSAYPPGQPLRENQQALLAHAGPDMPSTSHMVAVDAHGHVATWTGTVQAPFGSFLLVDGVLLNNELTDFAFVPARDGALAANRVQPGKRPRSSMSPTIVFDAQGRVVLALGSAGGARIIAHTLKTIIGVLDWDLSPQRAIEYPNFFKSAQGLAIEPGPVLDATKAGLEAMGHKLMIQKNVSGIQAIQARYGVDGSVTYVGGADPRREGIVLGD
jgi:gamma-glutamyltranspeptidase / glutathione hydrolase